MLQAFETGARMGDVVFLLTKKKYRVGGIMFM
jgi:hypothetical protein